MLGILLYCYKIEYKKRILFILNYKTMGALLDKVIQVLKIMPFVLYFAKNNKIKIDSEQEQFEDEWGQFCDISKKPLHNNNRDKPS